MFAEIKGVIDSVKIVSTMLEASKDLRNFNQIAAELSKVNTQLMSATAVALASQEKQSMLTDRIRELEDQLREVANWESQINRYTLHEFTSGAFAYKLQENMQPQEPFHYLCASCVNKKQKSILQPEGSSLKCHACGHTVYPNHQSSVSFEDKP
jgi:hypothetical protein